MSTTDPNLAEALAGIRSAWGLFWWCQLWLGCGRPAIEVAGDLFTFDTEGPAFQIRLRNRVMN